MGCCEARHSKTDELKIEKPIGPLSTGQWSGNKKFQCLKSILTLKENNEFHLEDIDTKSKVKNEYFGEYS